MAIRHGLSAQSAPWGNLKDKVDADHEARLTALENNLLNLTNQQAAGFQQVGTVTRHLTTQMVSDSKQADVSAAFTGGVPDLDMSFTAPEWANAALVIGSVGYVSGYTDSTQMSLTTYAFGQSFWAVPGPDWIAQYDISEDTVEPVFGKGTQARFIDFKSIAPEDRTVIIYSWLEDISFPIPAGTVRVGLGVTVFWLNTGS